MQAEQNSTPPLSHHRATFCCHAGFGGNGFVNKIGEDLFLFLAHLHNHSEELFLNGLDAFRVIFQESLTKPQSNTENKVMMNKLVAPKRCWRQPYLENSALTRKLEASKQTSSQLLEKTSTSRSKLAASFLKRAGTPPSKLAANFRKKAAKNWHATEQAGSQLLQKSWHAGKQAGSQLFQKTGTPPSKLAASSFKKLARH